MVEELKLAVKVDDDIVEQSLLKQFNNAEKLADKVVFTFKNVNLDNKEIEKQFKDMQKLAGKNPIELPIDTDKSLKMLQALGDEFTNIISIAKGLCDITSKTNGKQAIQSELDLYHMTEKRNVSYDEIIDKIQTIIKLQEKSKSLEGKKSSDGKYYEELFDEYVNWSDKDNTLNNITDRLKEIYSKFNGKITLIDDAHIKEVAYLLDMVKGAGEYLSGLNAKEKTFFGNKRFSNKGLFDFVNNDELLDEQIESIKKELSGLYVWFNKFEGVSFNDSISTEINRLTRDIQLGGKEVSEYAEQLLKIFSIKLPDTTTTTPFKEVKADAEKIVDSVKELNNELNEAGNKSNISLGNDINSSEIKNNEEVVNAIRKKKEELASYELKIEELRYELEKLSKTESESYGFKKAFPSLSDKQVDSFKERIYNSIFGTDKSRGYGLQKYLTMGTVNDDSVIKNYRAWSEELDKVGYKLSELRQTSIGVEADIIPIDGKAITNAEEFRKALFNVTTVPNDNIIALNSQLTELEGKVSSIKTEIKSLESISSAPMKDVFQEQKLDDATASAKELDNVLEQAFDVSTDDFDEILSKLDLTKSKLGEIVKITKQGHAGEDGKFVESFVLKDKNGSSETYGASSNTEKGQILRYNYIEKNTEAINKQKNAEKELQSQRDAFNKRNLNAIDMEIKKREEESSAYAKSLKAQMEERYSTISSMEKSLNDYNSKLEKFSVKPADERRYPIYQEHIDNLTKKIGELDTLKNNLSKKDIIDESDIKSVNNLQKEIDGLILRMNNMSAGERGFDPLAADKALEKINSELQKNSGMSKEAKRQIQGFYDEIRSGNPSKPIKDLLDDMYKIIQLEREAGRTGKSWLDIFKDKKIYSFLGQAASMFSFYDIINVGRQAVDIVTDINTQITELAKVSEATSSQIYDDFNSYAEIAKEVGGTISDTISATADWSRNGYNIPDSKELAEVALIYKNVGDGINIDQANEYLISTLRGFNLEAKDAMSIIDSMNEVANNEPISASGIGEALQRSAAAFNAANTSLQESIALTTSTNSVLQSPEKVGSMWTTVSARIRGKIVPVYNENYSLCA